MNILGKQVLDGVGVLSSSGQGSGLPGEPDHAVVLSASTDPTADPPTIRHDLTSVQRTKEEDTGHEIPARAVTPCRERGCASSYIAGGRMRRRTAY